jgi:hypothetical protein
MRERRRSYELSRSQVKTPQDVVKVFWRIVNRYRKRLSAVLDLGAGDGRFAFGGRYDSYTGLEIDSRRSPTKPLPPRASILRTCAFRHDGTGYSACIGNPPYVRHHDLDPSWRDLIAKRISAATEQPLNRKCNLYVYFMFLSILKANANGLVALIVPYEWVSRPAALPLRKLIQANGWQADTYRFSDSIFDSVETTAAITVIDKRQVTGEWNYYSLSRQGDIRPLPTATGAQAGLLPYTGRGKIWAMRGLSPGTQEIFTLSEGERIHYGLHTSDVYPCVTTLRNLPTNFSMLTSSAFHSRFVEAGLKCWLIRSESSRVSTRLRNYLDSVPPSKRATATCTGREPWYAYALPPIPDLLVSSGFVSRAPKTLINSVGAIPIGGVHGIHGAPLRSHRALQSYISTANLSGRVVAHSGKLRKLEIRQLNTVLSEFCES